MKMIFIYLIFFISYSGHTQEHRYNRGKYSYPTPESEIVSSKVSRETKDSKLISQKLAEVKFSIINGNLEKAKILLLQQGFNTGYGKLIKQRYLAIIFFMEGRYKQSLDTLNHEEFYFDQHFSHICSLKTLNQIILNEVASAKETWGRCNKLTIAKSPTLNLWPNVLVDLKDNPKEAIKKPFEKLNITNETINSIKLFLKLALYLNQQHLVIPKIPDFSLEALEDREIRELIGFLYYRDGKLVNSYQFIEDLSTPNSENIKGNLYLAQEKYDLAYGQFKLALNRKNNSQNALERITPVAWLLSQWEDGVNYVEKLKFTSEEERFKAMVLKASFETMGNDIAAAETTLKHIVRGSKLGGNKEVAQLHSLVSTELIRPDDVLLFANRACDALEPTNCWYLYHLEMWENLPLTLKREDNLFEGENEKLNALFTPFNETFKEESFIQQKEIEELDEKLIKLTNS